MKDVPSLLEYGICDAVMQARLPKTPMALKRLFWKVPI